MSDKNAEYMAQVMKTLRSNPTGADIDFLVEAHTRLGYLQGDAEGQAELSYAVRKKEEAIAFMNAMNGTEKVTAAAAERLAELEVYNLRAAEIEAKARATKIKNLLQSVTEAINAIKFLGKAKLG